MKDEVKTGDGEVFPHPSSLVRNPSKNRVEVVAAVLQKGDGTFLLAQRPPGKVYAGYWEFPGGKVEPGESPSIALARELHEELGIDVASSYPWLTRVYDYEHAAVRLHFRRATKWTGELRGREEQAFQWQRIGAVTASPLLPANAPILRALSLPVVYGITNASHAGIDAMMLRLERALAEGLRLVQLREKHMDSDALVELARRASTLAHTYGARIVVNAAPAIAERSGADGVHLSSARLMATPVRPCAELVGASCHNERELAHAARLELDFAVLGPVLETASHPGADALGWAEFGRLVTAYPLPVYAIGGLSADDLEDAWTAGAHGIAAIRSVWQG
jgi:8-oxo-dGTP diphosphatase